MEFKAGDIVGVYPKEKGNTLFFVGVFLMYAHSLNGRYAVFENASYSGINHTFSLNTHFLDTPNQEEIDKLVPQQHLLSKLKVYGI